MSDKPSTTEQSRSDGENKQPEKGSGRKRVIGKPAPGKPTIREWLEQHRDDYGDPEKIIQACMHELGVCRDAVTLRMRRLGISRSVPSSRLRQFGISCDDFKRRFDDETAAAEAIRKGLKELGENLVISDTDFRRFCQVTTSGWQAAAARFTENQFRCAGKTWWANEATVRRVLQEVRKATEL